VKETLGLPRSSVRASIVGLLIVASTLVAIFGSAEALAAFTGILGAAVRDYFAHRAIENAEAGPVLPEPAEG
jgi:hypothetical protein